MITTRPQRLLKQLIDVANGTTNICMQPETYCLPNGRPLLRVTVAILPEGAFHALIRRQAKYTLDLAIVNIDLLIASVSQTIKFDLLAPPLMAAGTKSRPRLTPVSPVPRIDDPWAWITAILYVALSTSVGAQDCLANRIARCEKCQRFFQLTTGRTSAYCSIRCRNAARAL